MTDERNRPDSADWADLAELWSSSTGRGETPTDLGERLDELTGRIRRRERRRRWWFAADLLVGAGVLALTTGVALARPGPVAWTALSYTVLVVIGAVLFTLWNRHRAGRHDLATAANALAAARSELRERRRGLLFAWVILGLHTLFFAIWLRWAGGGDLVAAYLFLAGWLALFTVPIVWLTRRARREAREIAILAAELEEPGQVPGPGRR